MSQIIELNACERESFGTVASRSVRRKSQIPAVIYGNKTVPQHVLLKSSEVKRFFEGDSFSSSIIKLGFDESNKEVSAVVKSLQRHPSTEEVMHVDFLKVDFKTPVTVKVALEFDNKESCLGLKRRGVLSVHLVNVDIIALPDNLPTSLKVDLSTLDLNQCFYLSDLQLPEGVTLAGASKKDFSRVMMVSVQAKRGSISAEEATE